MRFDGRAPLHEPLPAVKPALYKLDLGNDSIPLRFVRVRNARRYILRLTREGVARVTVPRGGTLEQAYAFARKNSSWLTAQLGKHVSEWQDGTTIFFRGEMTTLRISGDAALLNEHSVPLVPGRSIRHQVEVFLARLAAAELPERLRQLAHENGLAVQRIRIGNQRTRWGSCSASGAVSLNWRLIQTPPFVRDYIIVHELMHLREMNHSPRFWAHVAQAFPQYEEAERWLRKNGRALR